MALDRTKYQGHLGVDQMSANHPQVLKKKKKINNEECNLVNILTCAHMKNLLF